jgi:VRR-NUC domain.
MGKCKSKFTDLEKSVECQVLAWAFQNHWSIDVYDSKAIQSVSSRYIRNSGLKVGTPDLIGCDNQGNAVFLELKRPGKASVCSLEQRQFLERKIDCNAFCLVLDSSDYLQNVYTKWSLMGQKDRRDYLKSLLPVKVLIQKKVISLPIS